jgi:hypothetical protein
MKTHSKKMAPCYQVRNNANCMNEAVRRIKLYLFEIEQEIGKNNKLRVMADMFRYIVEQKEILFSYHRFKAIVRIKLNKLFFEDEWSEASNFYQQLFDQSIVVQDSFRVQQN